MPLSVQVRCADDRVDEWHVAIDGKRAVTFIGPGAQDNAQAHARELAALVEKADPPKPDRR
jgi:hypothetical protein